MIINQRDVVLVKFPFSDLTLIKVRPALVVSNNKLNSNGDDYLLIPITSVLKNVDYSILLKQEDFFNGRLIINSRLRVDKITSLDNKMVVKKIGIVNEEYFKKVKEILFDCF